MNTAINNTLAFFYATRPAVIFREQVTSQGTNQAYGLGKCKRDICLGRIVPCRNPAAVY